MVSDNEGIRLLLFVKDNKAVAYAKIPRTIEDFANASNKGFNVNKSFSYAGSDTEICPGTYDVIPSTFRGASGYFEIVGVNGRSYIKIHGGNNGGDTSGCLLPGTTYTFDSNTGEYSVWDSGKKLNELRDFLNQFGGGGISINISY